MYAQSKKIEKPRNSKVFGSRKNFFRYVQSQNIGKLSNLRL
jgi:hypothetical protein